MKPLAFVLALLTPAALLHAADPKKPQPTWTDPAVAAAEDPDFTVQGEYGIDAEGLAWGLQVIAMGDGGFDAYLLQDGLPGLGWTREKERIKLSGRRGEEGAVQLTDAEEAYAVSIDAEGTATVTARENGAATVLAELPRLERVSSTMGAEPPEGAIVLFDGSNTDEWEKGTLENGLLKNTDPHTKRKFGSYTLHLEFRTPYKPFARGQGRGNSGVYHQWRYETQVLDSFGLEGADNETGGVYKISPSRLNMCFPPLRWQTYDVDLTTARFDDAGNVTENAKITVRLNGVHVQENLDLPKTTGGARLKITPEPGPIYIQSHGNPVYYRNIWIVER